MKSAQEPKWDKQEPDNRIMYDPNGKTKEAGITEPLKIGQKALGIIKGTEIFVLLTTILSPETCEGRIFRIRKIWRSKKKRRVYLWAILFG
jgi:hypothetical protein